MMDEEIWAAARARLGRHGSDAVRLAVSEAAKLLEAEEWDRAATELKIAYAIRYLGRQSPPPALH